MADAVLVVSHRRLHSWSHEFFDPVSLSAITILVDESILVDRSGSGNPVILHSGRGHCMEVSTHAKKIMIGRFIPQFLSIVFVTTWLYLPLTKYFFFQDDYILLNMANRMAKWQDAFAPSETIFWRPLALGYFWLGQRVFGLDPYRFHLISLATHIFNALLVWLLVSRLTRQNQKGPVHPFLYKTQ